MGEVMRGLRQLDKKNIYVKKLKSEIKSAKSEKYELRWKVLDEFKFNELFVGKLNLC